MDFKLILLAVAAGQAVVGGRQVNVTETESTGTASVGDDVTFSCAFRSFVEEADRLWTAPAFPIIQGPYLSDNRIFVDYDNVTHKFFLTIKGVTLADDGKYECQRTSTSSRLKFLLFISRPPVSVSMSGDNGIVSVVKDQESNLTCTVHGSRPPATIKWFTNSVEVVSGIVDTKQVDSKEPSHATEPKLFDTVSTLSVKLITTAQNVSYRCEAIHMGVTAMSAFVTVTVLYAPSISLQCDPPSHSQKYREHQSVKLTCSHDSMPKLVTWRWFLGDALIAGVETSSYSIPDIPYTLNGQHIKCEASNTIGSANFSYPFIVEYPPRLKELPEVFEVDLMETVTFTCNIVGHPEPSITWQKKNSSKVLATGPKLTVAVTESDIGDYSCFGATRMFEEGVKADAYLLLKGPPRIVGDTDHYVSQGDVAVIVCQAESVPKVPTSFVWTRGRHGEVIDFSRSDKYTTSVTDTVYGRNGTLTIKDVTSDDFTVYNCTVTNSRGQVTETFRLHQKDEFPWQYAAIGVGSGLGLIALIVALVCCVKQRSKRRPTSCGSMSVTSNTTDNSTKKPIEGTMLDDYMPTYGGGGPGPVDLWNSEGHNANAFYDSENYPLRMDNGYETMDSNGYPVLPEIYSTFKTKYTPYPAYYGTSSTLPANHPLANDGGTLNRYGRDLYGTLTYGGDEMNGAPGPYNSLMYAEQQQHHHQQQPEQEVRSNYPLHIDLATGAEFESRLATNV